MGGQIVKNQWVESQFVDAQIVKNQCVDGQMVKNQCVETLLEEVKSFFKPNLPNLT